MEISFIRHGKSLLKDNKKKTCIEFKEWVKNYDLSGVLEEKVLPPSTIQRVADANVFITSDLKRSIDSAKLLRKEVHVVTDKLYREIELPVPSTGLWNIKISPSIWLILLRCLWLVGYTNDCESYKSAKQRAKKAVGQLIEYAEEYQKVAVVGHGFFNMLMVKELLNLGWDGKKMISSKHWSVSTYIYK